MNYREIEYLEKDALELEDFKAMDYYAVENFELPIELMMENAGLQLANLIANSVSIQKIIKIGIGNGNNGGGGLVAARRLSAWGYSVYLDIFTELTQDLVITQFNRAVKFGVKTEKVSNPDVWVDAYLGFSQKLPLKENLLKRLAEANNSKAILISLDIPTGFLGDPKNAYFKANKILTLAAPKRILYNLPSNTEIWVADLGIPQMVYEKFKHKILPFNQSNIVKLKR